MRNARFEMYFIAVYSLVPFGNRTKIDVHKTRLFLNLQVITAFFKNVVCLLWFYDV